MELTPKQREVAKHLKAGRGLAEIAEALGIQQTTLRMHLKGIRRFYGTSTYQEAIQKATKRGDL